MLESPIPPNAIHPMAVDQAMNPSPDSRDGDECRSDQGLAISMESVQRFLDEKEVHDTSKHVCVCGHAVNKHTVEAGWVFCTTARHNCPCKQIKAVLYASDTRYFMRKSYGSGSRHALSTGMMRLRSLKKRAFWLKEPKCWRVGCLGQNPNIYPVPMNESYQIVNGPGHYNVLLCETCYLIEKGVPGNEGKGWIW